MQLLCFQHLLNNSASFYTSSIKPKAAVTQKATSLAQKKTKKQGVQPKPEDDISSLRCIQYKCPHCDFIDPNKDSIKRHVVSVHKLKPFSCPHCNEGFTNFKVLNKHIQVNHPNEVRLKEPYVQIANTDSKTMDVKKRVSQVKPSTSGKAEINIVPGTKKSQNLHTTRSTLNPAVAVTKHKHSGKEQRPILVDDEANKVINEVTSSSAALAFEIGKVNLDDSLHSLPPHEDSLNVGEFRGMYVRLW